MVRRLALALALAAALPFAAEARCRQALALGLDVSGSVDATEYRLQVDGLAGALSHPDVRAALVAAGLPPVRLAIYEWSGPTDQHMLVGWTEITGMDALDGVIARLGAAKRRASDPSTALGAAMDTGAALLAQQSACWRRTLDISGDGKSNTGPRPRDAALSTDITVNALVIGADAPAHTDARQADIAELSSYFHANVLRGADAFVETALGFADYEEAMVRKLLRELQGLSLAQVTPDQ